MNKHEIEKKAADVLAATERESDPKKQFCTIWQGTIKPALQLVKLVTGKKMDEKIEKLEHSADLVCSDTHPDLNNFCKVWNDYKIETVLTLIKKITGKKTDEAIDKFIGIANSFCPAA